MLRVVFFLATFVFCGAALVGCGGVDRGGAPPYLEQVRQARQETDVELRAVRLIKIGYQQGKAQDAAGAEETLQLAAADCQAITDASARAGAWALLAEAHAGLGRKDAARRAARSALSAASEVKSNEQKAKTLCRAAMALGAVGETQSADDALEQAEKLAGRMDDPLGQSLAFVAIVGAYDRLDRSERRDRAMHSALQRAEAVADPKKRCPALAELAAQQAELGQKDAAAKTFAKALESAGSIEEPFFQAYALGELSQRLARGGFAAQARAVLNQAERTAETIPQRDLQAQALQRIRFLMSQLPRSEGT